MLYLFPVFKTLELIKHAQLSLNALSANITASKHININLCIHMGQISEYSLVATKSVQVQFITHINSNPYFHMISNSFFFSHKTRDGDAVRDAVNNIQSL